MPEIAPNLLRIGRHALIVSAETLPTGFNQRPGVTLLLARDQPLHVQIDGSADGKTTLARMVLVPAPSIRAARSSKRLVSRTPCVVFTTIG